MNPLANATKHNWIVRLYDDECVDPFAKYLLKNLTPRQANLEVETLLVDEDCSDYSLEIDQTGTSPE